MNDRNLNINTEDSAKAIRFLIENSIDNPTEEKIKDIIETTNKGEITAMYKRFKKKTNSSVMDNIMMSNLRNIINTPDFVFEKLLMILKEEYKT